MERKGLIFNIIILFFLSCLNVGAQNVTLYAGANKTLYDSRYYPALFGEGVAPLCPTFAVRLGWQDLSPTKLASITKNPEFGVGFQFDGFGDIVPANGPGVGNIYSLYAFIDRTFLSLGGFSLAYTGEFGMGIMPNKRFHPKDNPYNVMISHVMNAHISLGVQARYQITPTYNAGLAFVFNHYSNGAVTLPNFGLNKFELKLLVGVKTAPAKEQVDKEIEDDGFKRRFQFEVQIAGGAKSNAYFYEQNGVNKRYPRLSMQANALYRYLRTHATGLGIDIFYTPTYNSVKQADGIGNTDTPIIVGVSLDHEFCYNNLALMLGAGYYVYRPEDYLWSKSMYQLINLKYYLPQLANLYTGITLKAHGFKYADSVQFCLGKKF